jgi:hypothetical protein
MPSRGALIVGTQIKHPREETQLGSHIRGVSLMKLAGKEPVGRLEIAQRQDETDLVGRRAESSQKIFKALREVKKPLPLDTREDRRALEGGVFCWRENEHAWHRRS